MATTQLWPTGTPGHERTFSAKTTVSIDGSLTKTITLQYENVMIGSDKENNKWDILANYTP